MPVTMSHGGQRGRAESGVLLLATALALGGCSDDGRSGVPGNALASTTGGAGGALATNGVGGSGMGGSGGSSGAFTTNGAGGSGMGGSGASFVPEPIPDLDPEPAVACANIPPDHFQFLDDACKAKVVPSHVDRDLPCALDDASSTVSLKDGGTVTYQASSEAPSFDTASLSAFVPAELMATVILIRRVKGVPYYRYLSTGDHDTPYQPWSTTKVIAAANAAAQLRSSSKSKVGLTASVNSKPLGDLVTSVCNYDNSPYSSNSLGRYFHNIGTRKRANDLIHALWLKRPDTETFGGNYGELEPAALGYTFVDGANELSITKDTSTGPANHLSSHTMADMMRRLVLHREEPTYRMPGLQWLDVRVLFYGAEGSMKYGEWGGMSADTAVYLQSGHDMNYLEKRSHGRWRIFSKLGLGTSGQFLNVGYACLPVLDDQDAAVPGWGREFVIAAHLPAGGASWAERDRILAKAYRAIVTRIVDGRL